MNFFYLYSNLPKPLIKEITINSPFVLKLKRELLPLKNYDFVHIYFRDEDKFIYHKTEII